MMFRPLLLAALLVPIGAMAQPGFDPRSAPGGIGGTQPVHVHGSDGDGAPVIHRPVAPGVTNGVGTVSGGTDDNSVTYSGPSQGSFGGSRAPVVVGNDEGRPVVVR
jgi:hypothetical protein